MYLTDTKPAGNSTFDFMFDDMESFLLFSPKSYVTVINNTKLTRDQIDSIYKGAPFDANNHSTARVSFSVKDYEGNYFVYNYNLFYSWNGCSNQAISLNIDGTRNITDYIMCPVGVHEGDWERVSVLVCKSDWKVKRMAFSQHYWAEERDCTVEGQCLVDPETGHYMTFAGLDSHANYPEPSDLMVSLLMPLLFNYYASLFLHKTQIRSLKTHKTSSIFVENFSRYMTMSTVISLVPSN